jgi:hypothetical protein
VVVISTPIKFTEFTLDEEHVVEWFPEEFKKIIENKFENSKYCYSHSLALGEIYQAQYFRKPWGRVVINLISFTRNLFAGFNGRFNYQMLQYSISKVK